MGLTAFCTITLPLHPHLFLGNLFFHSSTCLSFPPGFTDEPEDLRGFPVLTQLIKGSRGFGFNIVGGSKPRELLQIYSVTASGPADLKTGKNE